MKINNDIDIIWCKRNLRISDNEILSCIDGNKKILGVYFFEPKIMALADYGNFQLKFILESLIELQQTYIKAGIPLLILPYDAVEGFKNIQKYFTIHQIHSHEETGNWHTFKRDEAVSLFCETEKIIFTEYVNNGVVRRLKTRDDWSHIWNERMSQDIYNPISVKDTLQIPEALAKISKNTKKVHWETVKNIQNLQKGGENEGKKILSNFLKNNSSKYMYYISKPLESQSNCSRLSPYIALGCLSIKYIVHESYKRIAELQSMGTISAKNHKKSINFFLARIHWQSHFIQKLEDQPELEFRNINPDFNAIRCEANKELIDSVFMARCGIPYIDAAISQLQQFGRTNFRSRAIIVSFLCNTCMQPWQIIGPRLARLFTDYEPGIHYPQLQMQAGTTGINTIRIYNPVYNGQQKDPKGDFIRKYLPQLKSVPTEFIHEPHLWENFGDVDYPEPCVDIKENNKIAKDLLWCIKGNIPKAKKEKIVKKHASRVFKGKKLPKKIKALIFKHHFLSKYYENKKLSDLGYRNYSHI